MTFVILTFHIISVQYSLSQQICTGCEFGSYTTIHVYTYLPLDTPHTPLPPHTHPSHSQDDPNLEDYNVDQKVEDFVKAIATQQKFYRHNHIMLTMGEDFQWENAREWYKNLDKLMKYTMEKVSGVA